MTGSWTRLREGDLCPKKLRTIWKAMTTEFADKEFKNDRCEINRCEVMKLIGMKFGRPIGSIR